ncbi:MAG TPA: phosphatase PAP2 family protein [Gemmatimonadaceae bacterium]|nr:phosphatase PAP2 family protein [Gemmatimonadaceae bacterium]
MLNGKTARLTAPALMLWAMAAGAQPPEGAVSDKPLFTRADLVYAGAVAIGTLAISPLDRQLADYLQGDLQTRRFLRRVSVVVENIAVPGAFIIGGTLYAAGRLGGDSRMAELGLRGTEAILIGLAVTTAIKVSVGRARPLVDRNPRDFELGRGWGQDEYRSFPSGHALIAFAAATIVLRETHQWWPESSWYVGPAMYGGAILVALSRMYDNKHWASDVIMGGALGIFTGNKVWRFHQTNEGNDLDRWLLGVSISPGRNGGRAISPILVPMRD